MSYEIFNAKTSWKKRGKPPVIRVSTTGHIRWSVEAIRRLGLVNGDKVSFMTDARDNGIIYFYRDNKNGIPLIYCTKGKDGVYGLQVCCRPLAYKILNFFGFTEHKTFDLTDETLNTENGRMWFILKGNIHRPIKWRKEKINKVEV